MIEPIWDHLLTNIFCYISYNLGQFAMPDTYENWIGQFVYYAHQTGESYQVLHYSVDFKAARELWNPHRVRQYLVNVVLILIKDL